MSEKDLNRQATEADLENVSGGRIETSKGTFGKTLYRANINGEKGDWRVSQRSAKFDEDNLILKQFAKNNSDYHKTF